MLERVGAQKIVLSLGYTLETTEVSLSRTKTQIAKTVAGPSRADRVLPRRAAGRRGQRRDRRGHRRLHRRRRRRHFPQSGVFFSSCVTFFNCLFFFLPLLKNEISNSIVLCFLPIQNSCLAQVAWLSHTFLAVRLRKNPISYGASFEDKRLDPTLREYREKLCAVAAS